jgi:hypothetical protein
MKAPILAILLVFVMTATSSAQGTLTQEARAQLHSGSVKIWLGAALIGAGALAIPITAGSGVTGGIPAGAVLGGMSTVATGTYLVWLGAGQQRKAVGRSLTFGASIGRSTRIQVRKSF